MVGRLWIEIMSHKQLQVETTQRTANPEKIIQICTCWIDGILKSFQQCKFDSEFPIILDQKLYLLWDTYQNAHSFKILRKIILVPLELTQ